jgi:hypothetical protein
VEARGGVEGGAVVQRREVRRVADHHPERRPPPTAWGSVALSLQE